jgi:ABC-type Fe3+-hydroxamate transport system substrate-binding protein
LIWKKPWMAAGKETFIHQVLALAGFENCITESRYPVVALKNINANLILLSSEPYPFKDKHIKEIQEQLPNVKCIIVDGEIFSWYGSRMLKAAAYLKELRNQVDQL